MAHYSQHWYWCEYLRVSAPSAGIDSVGHVLRAYSHTANSWCVANLRARAKFRRNNRSKAPFKFRVDEQNDKKRKRDGETSHLNALRDKVFAAQAMLVGKPCTRYLIGQCNRWGADPLHPNDPVRNRTRCQRSHLPPKAFKCAHGTKIEALAGPFIFECSFTKECCPYLDHP